MKKSIKTKMQGALLTVAVCCLFGGVFCSMDNSVETSAQTVVTAATYEVAGEETTISLTAGASIRYVSEEESAIRFSVTVENWLDDVSYGIIVAKYVDGFDDAQFTHSGSYTIMDLNSEEEGFKSTQTATGRTFSLVVTDISEEDFRFNFAAKAYVKDGSTYTYTGFSHAENVRSVARVAATALKMNNPLINADNMGMFLNYAGLGNAVQAGADKIRWNSVYGVDGYEIVEGKNQAETLGADKTEYAVKGTYAVGDKVTVSVRPLFTDNDSVVATTVSFPYGMILLNDENCGMYDVENLDTNGSVTLVQNSEYTVFGKNSIRIVGASGQIFNYFRFPAVNLGSSLTADKYLEFDVYNPNDYTLKFGIGNNYYGKEAASGFSKVQIALNSLAAYAVQNSDGTYSLRTGASGNRYTIILPNGKNSAGDTFNTDVGGTVELYFSGFRISEAATAMTISLDDYQETVETTLATVEYTLPTCRNENHTVSVWQNGTPVAVENDTFIATKGKSYQIVYTATNAYGVRAEKTIEVNFVGVLPTLTLAAKTIAVADSSFTVPTPETTNETSLTWKLYNQSGAEVGTSSSETYGQLTNGLYSLVYTATNEDGDVSAEITVLVTKDETLILTAADMYNNGTSKGAAVSLVANAKANGYAIVEDQAICINSTGTGWHNLWRFPKIHVGSQKTNDRYFVFDVYSPTAQENRFYTYNGSAAITELPQGFTRVAIPLSSMGKVVQENGEYYIWQENEGSRDYICLLDAGTVYISGFRISSSAYENYLSVADYESLYLMTAATAEYILPVCANEGYAVSVKQGETVVPVSANKITVEPNKTYVITYSLANAYGLSVYTKTVVLQTTEALMGETLVTSAADIVANTPERRPETDGAAGKIGVYKNAYAEGKAKYETTALSIYSKAANIYIRLPKIALGSDLSADRYFVFDVYNPQTTNVTMAGISATSLAPGWNTVRIKLSTLSSKTVLEEGTYYLYTEPLTSQSYLGINVNQNFNSSYQDTGVTLYFSGFRVTNQA